MENILSYLELSGKEIIFLGDTNCDLLSDRVHMKELYDGFGFKQLIDKPTRETLKTKTLIDHAATTQPGNIVESGIYKVCVSDHYLIYCVRKLRGKIEKSPKLFESRQLKWFNKEKFLEDLGQVYWEDLVDYDNPDAIVYLWTKMFTGILDKHAPLRKRKGKNTYSPWVTTDLVKKRRSRDILKKRALALNSEILMHAYRNLRNQVNRENERLKQQYFSNEIKRVEGDTKGTWKTVNKLLNKRSKTTEIPYLEEDGEIITDPQNTADKLNTYFSTIGEKVNSTFTANDNSSLPPQVNSRLRFKIITEISVLKAIKALKPKRSFGPDKVSSFFIRIAAPVIAKSLSNIYNTSIRSGVFPKDWKIAKVAPIFKSGSKSQMGNYRPISVLPTLARIFEKLVSTRINLQTT